MGMSYTGDDRRAAVINWIQSATSACTDTADWSVNEQLNRWVCCGSASSSVQQRASAGSRLEALAAVSCCLHGFESQTASIWLSHQFYQICCCWLRKWQETPSNCCGFLQMQLGVNVCDRLYFREWESMFSPSSDAWVEDGTFEPFFPVQRCESGHEFACEGQLQAKFAAAAVFMWVRHKVFMWFAVDLS